MAIEWINDSWGVTLNHNRYISNRSKYRYSVVFGDDEMAANSGLYPTKRRAKKEIAHYINRGLSRGPFHGANQYLKITRNQHDKSSTKYRKIGRPDSPRRSNGRLSNM
jgi:hypothetical protein